MKMITHQHIIEGVRYGRDVSNRAKINAVINFYKRLIVWRLKSSPSRLSTGRIGED